MRRFAAPLALLLVLAMAQTGRGQIPLDVKGDGVKTVVVVQKFPFTVSAPSGAALYFWSVPAAATWTDRNDSIEVLSAPRGEFTVNVKAVFVDWDKKKIVTQFGAVTVSVGDGPGPKPPDPVPPVPVPTSGLKVLIVEEEGNRSQLPKGQKDIIIGKDMRDWLIANCSPDPFTTNGKGYGIWDKDVAADNVPRHWADALARGRTLTMPAVVIMDGTGAIIQAVPLPADPEAVKTLLGKYLPAKRKAA